MKRLREWFRRKLRDGNDHSLESQSRAAVGLDQMDFGSSPASVSAADSSTAMPSDCGCSSPAACDSGAASCDAGGGSCGCD